MLPLSHLWMDMLNNRKHGLDVFLEEGLPSLAVETVFPQKHLDADWLAQSSKQRHFLERKLFHRSVNPIAVTHRKRRPVVVWCFFAILYRLPATGSRSPGIPCRQWAINDLLVLNLGMDARQFLSELTGSWRLVETTGRCSSIFVFVPLLITDP